MTREHKDCPPNNVTEFVKNRADEEELREQKAQRSNLYPLCMLIFLTLSTGWIFKTQRFRG
jgi:hypothetical protein